LSVKLRRIKGFFRALGPGLITGAADDDPSGIATYSQAGARAGFGLLWTALLTIPLMSAIQEMSARIGIVTGQGISGNLRKYYSKKLLILLAMLVLVANIINIGADIAGMAAAAHLLWSLVPETFFVVVFAGLILILMVFLSYREFASVLKWLTLALVAYLLVPFTTHINWGEVLRNTIVPHISWDKGSVTLLVAILGTTISPYLFFWQADMEVEEEKSPNADKFQPIVVMARRLRLMREDVTAGMIFSNVVMWFIIITAASTLFARGITNINTAQDAAAALRPIAGDFATLLFTLGIVGTGMLAIPILAGSASYVLSEALGWVDGLEKSFSQAKGFYLVIIVATLLGAGLSFFGFDPIKLLFYTAVIYGLVSPPLIFIILHIANNPKIMGDKKNGFLSNALSGLTLVLMAAAGLAFIWLNFLS
jgi:NRAMP (natural resistance-associated macrophage protein)-like metal ion transporter